MTPALSTRPIAPAPAPSPAQGAHTRLLMALAVFLLLAAPLAAFVGLALQQRPSGGDASMTMEAANALYNAGQFEVAAQAYQQLVAQGQGGRALLYNLGVAHLEAGSAAEAVDALRIAQRAYPRAVDIRSALADAERLTRSSAPPDVQVDASAPAPVGAQASAANAASRLEQVRLHWLSATEVALSALLLWALLAGLLLIAYTAPRRSGRRRIAAVAAVLVGAALVFALLLLTV